MKIVAAMMMTALLAGCDSASTAPPDAGPDVATASDLLTDQSLAADGALPDTPLPDAPLPDAPLPDAPLIDAAPDTLPWPKPCTSAKDCDDGLTCTADTCVGGFCVTSPASDCAWPAEPAPQAANLTHIEGPLVNDFHKDLSGAVWDPQGQVLWVCRNTGSDSRVWAVEPDGKGSFQIAYRGGKRGEWSKFGDLEGLTLASLSEPDTLYLLVEGPNKILEYDLSAFGGAAVLKRSWDTGQHMPAAGNAGAEGITFVPDAVLKAQGFVDAAGKPYLSKHGMGGIMLVGHQTGGAVYAFDLNRATGGFSFVGAYQTQATETAALELDRSTGLLYLWHGAAFNTLEVARLSSTLVSGKRTLDAQKVYRGPAKILLGSDNHEGIAVMPADSCSGGQRGFFLTTDGGGFWSLLWYRQFPCF